MKIVHLDTITTTMDGLSLDRLESLGEFTAYEDTSYDETVERAKDADIIITNKVVIDKAIIDDLPNLKYICVSATGYNVVDVEHARTKGIAVSNVAGYSTPGVVQFVFSHMLNVYTSVAYYDNEVELGRWPKEGTFCFYDQPIQELHGKTMGIIGLGTIGKQVAAVALAFGMNVIAHSRNPERDQMNGVEFLSLEDIYKNADVISLHCSLNPSTEGMINTSSLTKMKDTAVLINTGRGGLIVEQELADALNNGDIYYACLDVLSSEPPLSDNPLLKAKHCIITPHIAWASIESRIRLIEGIAQNIEAFIEDQPLINVVN